MTSTHLCFRPWCKVDPRCRRMWGKVMWGSIEGQVSPPEPVEYGPSYIKEILMLKGPCCLLSYYAYSLKKFSSSIIRHFFCPSACSRRGAYNVLLLRLFMSPGFYPLHILTEFLYCCLSVSVPNSFYSWANSFPFQAVWCSCLSLSVSLPLFWHLHAVKDRQTLHRHWQVVPRHKTGFDAVSGRLQNVWPTLYIKALWSLRSGKKQSEYFRWPKSGSH